MQKTEKILSISIAAYNVESYIEQTLNSFITDDETMKKLEVLVVNDGSKDKTSELAKIYQMKYPDTFVVIDKENGGYGSTINASLSMSQGKYYRLVDGDDWVKTDELRNYIAFLEQCESDLIITKYCTVQNDSGEEKIIDNGFIYDSKERVFGELKLSRTLPMHHAAIKTKIIKENEIHITENCFYTDIEFTLKPCPYINTVTCYDAVIYMYRMGREGQSIQLSSWHKNIDQALKVTLNMAKYYEQVKMKNGVASENLEYLLKAVTSSAQAKYRILLSMPRDLKAHEKAIEYDKRLRNISQTIYDKTISTNSRKYRWVIKTLRVTKFKTFRYFNRLFRSMLKINE